MTDQSEKLTILFG
jgi:hypothetical protein